jgi:Tol biopolymer transport system component
MNLWRIRLDESSGNALARPEPITTPASLLAHISVSQDGRRIAYASALLTQNIQKMAFDPVSGEVRSDPSPVTTGSRLWSSPDASADGQWVVFYSQGQPEGDLYVSGIDGTRLRQVTGDSAVDRVPRWSPDGEWIACFSNRAGPFDLWKVRPDGSDLTQITTGAGVTYAAWSPDGSRIATSAAGVGHIPQGTYIVDPNRPGSEQKAERLPPFPGGRFIANSWSPDGAQIAGQIEMTGKGIATWSMRDRRYRRWTDYGEWPAWLPDSRRILFVSRGKQFFVLDTASGEVRQIFSSPRDVFGPPRFGGPGDAIYFSRRATESDVWIATLDGR